MEAALRAAPEFDLSLWLRLGERITSEPTSAAGEIDLVRAARGGDRGAFGKLIELHKRAVYGVAHRLLGPSEASDASQEAFLRAYQRLASFDPSQPLRPWLLGITRHYCVDELRRRGRQPMTDALETAERVTAEAPEPEAQIEIQEQSERVKTALAALPPNHREALVLFHQEQLSYRDIAGVLNVPIGTVMTWIHRARRALRAQLEVSA